MKGSLTALLFVVLLGGGLASGAVTFTSPEIGGPSPDSLVDTGVEEVTFPNASLSENKLTIATTYWVTNNVSIDGELRNTTVDLSWRPGVAYEWTPLGTHSIDQILIPGGERTTYTESVDLEGDEVGKFEVSRRSQNRSPDLRIEIDTEIHGVGPNPINREFDLVVNI